MDKENLLENCALPELKEKHNDSDVEEIFLKIIGRWLIMNNFITILKRNY